MQLRHEWKHEINASDFVTIVQRLKAVAKPDVHTVDGRYRIRSLYFDNLSDKALKEKLDGVNMREKFRIRYYNDNLFYIRLEKKSKYNGLCSKETAGLSALEVQALLEGDSYVLKESGKALAAELYSKMLSQGIYPKTIVEYTRMPFVYEPGNVRVTLDYDIRTGYNSSEFLNPEAVTIPTGTAHVILEVKWDAFLPEIIRDAIWTPGRRSASFSKYAACRCYC